MTFVTAAAHRLILLAGWRRAAAAFIAGALSALAMPPFGIFPILALTLPALVWLVDGTVEARGRLRAARSAAFIGWAFGFGYFLAGLWWIGSAFLVDTEAFAWMMPFAVIGLPIGLALFPALGLFLARLLWRDGTARIFALGVGLGASEWLRGHILTGFPWNSLGYALADHELIGQTASLVGMEGLTPIAIILLAAPATLIDRGGGGFNLRPTFIALAGLVSMATFGALRLPGEPVQMVADFSVRIVQPDIPQDDKFRIDAAADIMARYVGLSRQSTGPDHPDLSNTDLLVWPESAFPFLLSRSPSVLAMIAELLPEGAVLATGAARAEGEGEDRRVYNSIQMVATDGSITATYDKVNLVPFGEFLPFQSALEAMGIRQLTRLPGGFSAGDRRRNIVLANGLKLAPLICYEVIFPNDLVDTNERPDALLNVTNDAWFGITPGPHQHFSQARIRAIEQGLPLIRSANNGISGVVDPWGRTLEKLALGDDGVLDSPLPSALSPTIYTRHGFALFGAIYALSLAAALLVRRRFDIT